MNDVAQAREEIYHQHRQAIDKPKNITVLRPRFSTVLTKISSAAWNPNTPQVERYWTASQLANAFGHHISTAIQPQEFHQLEKLIIKILRSLYNGFRMLKDRGRRHIQALTPSIQTTTHTTEPSQYVHRPTTPNPPILNLLQVSFTPKNP